MWNDVRYGVRTLRTSPGFATIVVATLAIGIGASTAIFSVVHALVFKPLPYPGSERLMVVSFEDDSPIGYQFWPYPKYEALRDQQRTFDVTAAYGTINLAIQAGDTPERVAGEIVTPSYFSMFGVTASHGRVFGPEVDRDAGRASVIVLGDALWRSGFGADPQIIGKTLTLKQRPYEVIGIAPPSFRGQSGRVQFWVPMMAADHLLYQGAATQSSSWWTRVIARLRRDVTESQARSELPLLGDRVRAANDAFLKTLGRADGREHLKMVPLKDARVDPLIRQSFVLLFGAMAIVVAIACANTANLLLGRAASRQREFAVRRAIGASRAAIVRQVLAESLLLGAAAGALGVLVARVVLQWLVTAKPWNTTGVWSQYAQTFDYFTPSLDERVLAFNFALAAITALVFGITPAWQAANASPDTILKRTFSASSGGFRRLTQHGPRSALVLAEIAFSLVLLTGAGLTVRTLLRLWAIDTGIDPQGIVTATMSIEGRRPLTFYRDLLARIESIPGVERATLSDALPFAASISNGSMTIDGRQSLDARVRAALNIVSPRFFATYGIRVLHGRAFDDSDRETAPRAAIVSKEFARQAWPGLDPIGQRVRTPFRVAYGEPGGWWRVVGVVDDVKFGLIEDPAEAVLYLPAWQPLGSPQAVSLAPDSISVRTTMSQAAVTAAIRARVHAVAPGAPLYDIGSMDERAAKITSRYRYGAVLLTGMAAIGVLLAAVGVYAVIAYSVASRRREIAICLALGARPAALRLMLVWSGVRLAAIGAVFGLAGALAASRLLSSSLVGVSATDPATYVLSAIAILAVTALATLLPARAIVRFDPAQALRAE